MSCSHCTGWTSKPPAAHSTALTPSPRAAPPCVRSSCTRPPLLTGRDLIELGYTPGPEFSSLLRQLEEGQLDGSLTTRTEAIARVRQISGKAST